MIMCQFELQIGYHTSRESCPAENEMMSLPKLQNGRIDEMTGVGPLDRSVGKCLEMIRFEVLISVFRPLSYSSQHKKRALIIYWLDKILDSG
jgi:hypothetical protein